MTFRSFADIILKNPTGTFKKQENMKKILFLIGIIPTFLICNSTPTLEEECLSQVCANPALSFEIIEMARLDQLIRSRWIQTKDDALLEEIKKIDQLHSEKLTIIIKAYGWPGIQLVGNEGADAMWLLVQHSPNLEFQKKCLILLEDAVLEKDALPKHFAYLKDRILVTEGKKQIYGTQLQLIEGKVIFYPIEDEDSIDSRRSSVGLCPLAEYKILVSQMYEF